MDTAESKKVKVLAIVPSAFCFGLQNLTLDFFRNVSPRIHPFFLNTKWNDGEFPRRLDSLGIQHSATWLGMFSRRLDLYNLKMTLHCLIKLPIAYWDFVRLYRRIRPDVVYLANHHEIILLWPLLFLLRHKVVCHMHDPPPAIPFQRMSFAIWRQAVNRFLFISESVRKRTELLGPIGPRDKVVMNGVYVSELGAPRTRDARFTNQFGWSQEVVVIGITGQMTLTKGHEDFLIAAKMSAAKDSRLRFVVGSRPMEPMFSRLKELIKENMLEDRVVFSGWLPTPQDFFSAIDILVMASRHDEGFGLVVAEAMERGAVVVATRSGGAVEIIEEGANGCLINKQAPSEMAERLLQLSSNQDMRNLLSAAGRARVESHFNLLNQANAFENELIRYV